MTASHLAISALLCAAKWIALEERPRDLGRVWDISPIAQCLATSGSLCFMHCVVIQMWQSKNILPAACKGCLLCIPLLFLKLSGRGKNKLTNCIATCTWGLENTIHPVLKPSTLCPKCTSRMCQTCSQLRCWPWYAPVGITGTGL